MGKSHDKQIRSRLIPPTTVAEQRTAAISTRPLKLAFLINEATPKDQLLKYIEYNSTVWGGFYNSLIPTDGKSLRSCWWQILLNHSPDKVVLCGEISEGLMQEIHDRAQPYAFWLWNDDAVGGEKIKRDSFGSIPLAYHLFHIYETSRPILKSNFRIIQVDGESPYLECAAAQFGIAQEPYRGIYVEALQSQAVNCGASDLGEYLSCLTELENRLTPLKTTKYNLKQGSEMLGAGFTIVLVGENPVADLCLFWSLRMRPSLGRIWTIVLPASALRRERNVQALAKWCDGVVLGTNYITLASATLGRRRLLGIKKRLAAHLTGRVEHVDIWFDDFRINPIRVYETESSEELRFEDRRYRLKTPAPSFAEHIRDGEWVIDVRMDEGGSGARSTFLPPTYSGLTALLSGNPPDWVVKSRGFSARMSAGQISNLVCAEQEFLRGKLPSDDEIFSSLFDNKRYRATQTDKCRYARGVTSLIGGLEELKIWREGGVRDLFYAMKDGRSSYTPKEMMGWLRPKSDSSDKAHSMVTDLALKKVFLRGYKLQCPACDLTRWYPVSDLAETMPCAGCLTLLQPHVEVAFRYRLNDLVARGLDQGTMSLMLTALFLQSLARDSFMYVPGLEVFQTRRIDVDIAASCDGHLVLAECKDLRGGASAKTIEDVISQFADLIAVASDVGAAMAILSILQPSASAELSKKVEMLGKKWRRTIAVHLLTGKELERGHRMKPMGDFLSPEDPSKETQSTLHDFLLATSYRERGWVKEKGARSLSF